MSARARNIAFVKANGCGNDFLIIEERLAPADMAGFVRRICDRHIGVGADGVEWISGSDGESDILARLSNSDGSEAEISGNGTRCVAAYFVADRGGDAVRVKTGAGTKVCKLIGRDGNRFEFSSTMGAPRVDDKRTIKTSVGEFTGTQVSMGNPHFVTVVSELAVPWQQAGSEIQSKFAGGVNVEFVRVIGPHLVECRFFERGAGETRSSGTGSCAAAVATIMAGLTQSPVLVKAPGGDQTVEWEGPGKDATLRGPAEIIFRGEYFL